MIVLLGDQHHTRSSADTLSERFFVECVTNTGHDVRSAIAQIEYDGNTRRRDGNSLLL